MPGPLDGIRVVEMAVIHVGPPIGYILGDLGAEVLKIERPDGGDPDPIQGHLLVRRRQPEQEERDAGPEEGVGEGSAVSVGRQGGCIRIEFPYGLAGAPGC